MKNVHDYYYIVFLAAVVVIVMNISLIISSYTKKREARITNCLYSNDIQECECWVKNSGCSYQLLIENTKSKE